MNRVLLARSKVLAGLLLALALLASGSMQVVKADHMQEPRIGLEGYCPVCIVDANKWAKGSPSIRLLTTASRTTSRRRPSRRSSWPTPRSMCPPWAATASSATPSSGSASRQCQPHCAVRQQAVPVPGAEQQQAFLSNPKEFANVDLALNGDCAVCQVHANKRVAGKPEFTEIKNGFRYQFVSDREQAAFRKDPAHYVDSASKPNAMDSRMSQRPAGNGALGGMQMVKADHMEQPQIGLGGYCPVCILDANKWAKGSPEHQATYDGVTYYFPEEAIKEKFLANPAKYVPALGGDCIVCYAKLGKRVPGTINHTARYDNRLFLFPGAEQQQAFLSNPKEFANVDLALNGDCVVCQVHANKRVAGKPEFTEIKGGFRYQFVSASEQAAFRKDPAAYVDPASKPNAMESPTSQRPKGNDSLTVMGKTACAGCEYGVTPLQNPEELGLAVNTDDGRVVIVEHAHKLYRSVYENRFAGEPVRVSGRVIKQRGRFTWLEPTDLMVQK